MNEDLIILYQLLLLLVLVSNKFQQQQQTKNRKIISTVLDDDDAMEYLNDWDNKLLNLDVVDDYKSEKKEILKCQGKHFPFSFGDVSFIFKQNIRDFVDSIYISIS